MTEQCQVMYRSDKQDDIGHVRAQQLVAACADRQGDNEDSVERALRCARRTAATLDTLDEFEFVVPDELERQAVVDWSRRPRDTAQTAATADEIIASPPVMPPARPPRHNAEQVQHMRTVRLTRPPLALPRHGDDAILRLIPFPFKACSGPGTAVDYFPEQVRHASIHYSYLDLDSSGEFKLARALLRPGRRGAWIIPLDPCPSTGPFARSRRISFGVWPTSPSRQQGGNDIHDEDAKEIAWHDERLSRLWKGLSRLASANKMGRLTATCHFATTALPAHIRVYVDSHLALAVRDLISKLDKGGLAMNRLLYINEEGAAILTA